MVDLRPPAAAGASADAAAAGLGPAPGESATARGCLVQEGVSEELDGKRHLYDGLPDLLTQVAQGEAQRVPPGLIVWRTPLVEPTMSVVYLPKARRTGGSNARERRTTHAHACDAAALLMG